MQQYERAELEMLLQLLEEKKRREDVYLYRYMYPKLYPWQQEFVAATATYSQCALIAANRIGKTMTGTYMDAIHALGDYPDEWEGHRFNHAPLIWCLGYSGEKVRDLLQTPIIGRKDGDTFVGGLIPPERIIGYESMTGTPNAVRTVLVRHASGGVARIQFWSYSQGQHALMGDGVDWFHVDEEPQDIEIWPQVLTRTATGDEGRGGRGILTLTPENGRTELVIKFLDEPSAGQFCMQKGWDDAPHLSERIKEELLASYPKHQRDMRTKGIPMLGHGRIYDLAEDDITCEPFPIPKHFLVIDGMDFGWDHPQAHVQLVIDPEQQNFYVTRAWKKREAKAIEAWGATKTWAQHVPTAWPADGLQHEKGSAKQQKVYYTEAGFTLLPEHATWPDGSNGVEAGLFEIRTLMMDGKFKVFEGLRDLITELLQYHRKPNGKINKTVDDILDAMRYAYMMRRFAIRYGDIGPPKVIQVQAIPMSNAYGKR
ncbi:MAG: terminase family protein [Pseudomonadota bacterium]